MRLIRISAVLTAVVSILSSTSLAVENVSKRSMRAGEYFEIKAAPFGPKEADVEAAKRRIAGSPSVVEALGKSLNRLLSFEFLNGDADPVGSPPTRFRAIYYNYSDEVAVIAEGDFNGKGPITVSQEKYDPIAGFGEFEAAQKLVSLDPSLSAAAKGNQLEFYDPMPPVSNLNGERLVNVGVRNLATGENQIVGVSFKNQSITRFEQNAPPTARAAPAGCGFPGAQGSTGRGLAGQLTLTAQEPGNPNPVWEMIVVRPSASSGGEGSGVEVRDVKYRGKSVLKRGHLPVLNVQYIPGTCGPFRDWQYAEGFFQVPTSGVTFPNGAGGGFATIEPPGIATTIVETQVDSGNFQGVAIYQQNVEGVNEMVLVSEMNAGWYRYIMEWRFGYDGRIRPRFGFGSVTNSCVCIQRNHHAYWRFDFDVVSPNNKIFMVERGRKFIKPVATESAFFRSYQRNRSFLIQNANGDEAYSITPNLTDSSVTNDIGVLTDSYGKGDFWLFRFSGTAANPGELNDPNTGSSINVDPWLTGESLVNQDSVIWYGAHQTRQDDASLHARPNVLNGVHTIGPDLRPVRW